VLVQIQPLPPFIIKEAKTMAKQKEINVSILGKGEEKVSIEKAQTIGELRTLLALDSDVVASDAEGNELSDSDIIDGNIDFVPNVEGGQ